VSNGFTGQLVAWGILSNYGGSWVGYGLKQHWADVKD